MKRSSYRRLNDQRPDAERDITKARSKNTIRRGASYFSIEETSDLRIKNILQIPFFFLCNFTRQSFILILKLGGIQEAIFEEKSSGFFNQKK